MIENIQTVKDYVYILLEQSPSEKTDFIIETLVDEILAYCYREDVPPMMVRPIADVISAEIKSRAMTNSIDGTIASLSEGDMSISFANGTTSLDSKYGRKLEKFKKIRGLFDV